METQAMPVINNIEERNKNNLQVPAFEGLGESIDYKTFFDAVDTYAKGFLELGVKDKDVVTLCLAGTLDTIINIYALNKIGAVSHVVNPNFLKINSHYIDDANSDFLVIMDRFYPVLCNELAQTKVKKIVLSSLTEYSSILYKILISRKKIPESDLIQGVEYFSLPEFIKIGEASSKIIETPNYENNKAAAIVYTSGTTGNPKAIVLTNESFNNMISIYDKKNGFGSNVGDRNLLIIPPMYGTSLCHCINTPLAFGCTTILQPLYRPQNFEKDLKKFKPNIVVGSKAHYISLLNSNSKKGSLKFLKMPFTGGEPITAPLATRINEKLNYLGAPNIIIGYGMSELGTMAMFNMDVHDRVNQSGYLLSDDIQARIIDPITGKLVGPNEEGDLQISSPCCMSQYLNNSQATSAFFVLDSNGKKWCRTNDIATVDEKGVYNVLGRKNDSFVNEYGQVIYLFKIENLIEEIKYVRECEVIAVTIDNKKVPLVHVILTKEGEKVKCDVIKLIDKICKDNLASYEIPYAYKLRDSFNTSPVSGKRDYECLKYETSGYYIVNNDSLEPIEIVSDESKTLNKVESVKKYNLKI
jgi:acyl-coenzyme A synthetase/AMP-(fatty) acid ligase